MSAKLGDFFLGISAKADTTGVDTFSNKLSKLSLISLGVDKGLSRMGQAIKGIFIDTAEETAELGRLAKDLGVSVEFVDKFQRLFMLAGGTAESANTTIRTLQKTITGFKFGEGEFKWLSIFGISPQEFTKDVEHNFSLIREAFKKLEPEQKVFAIERLGFGEDILRVLRLTNTEYAELKKHAEESQILTEKNTQAAIKFQENIVRANIAWTSFKRNLLTTTLPALTETVQIFNDLLSKKIVKQTAGTISQFPLIVFSGIGNIFKGIKDTYNSPSLKESRESIRDFSKGYREENKKEYPKGFLSEVSETIKNKGFLSLFFGKTEKLYEDKNKEFSSKFSGKEEKLYENKEKSFFFPLFEKEEKQYPTETTINNTFNVEVSTKTNASAPDIANEIERKLQESFQIQSRKQQSGLVA